MCVCSTAHCGMLLGPKNGVPSLSLGETDFCKNSVPTVEDADAVLGPGRRWDWDHGPAPGAPGLQEAVPLAQGGFAASCDGCCARRPMAKQGRERSHPGRGPLRVRGALEGWEVLLGLQRWAELSRGPENREWGRRGPALLPPLSLHRPRTSVLLPWPGAHSSHGPVFLLDRLLPGTAHRGGPS